MLEQMRKFSQHFVVKVLFLFVACMFVLWGIGDVFRNNIRAGYIATVGKSGVTEAELDNMLKSEIEQYQKMTGKTLTAEEIEKSGAKQYALGQIIRDKVTTMRASDLNLTGGNKDVAVNIQENKAFFDEKGKFDKDRFKQILRDNGLTEEKFVSSIKNEAAVRSLLETLSLQGVAVDSIAKQLYIHRNEKRVADIITIPADSIKEIADPAETDLVQFYQEHQDNFSIDEQRAFSYITFNADKIKNEIKISDEELKAQYQSNIQEYKTEETRDVSQYLFSKQEEATAAYEKISKGEAGSFASSKIDLGKVTKLTIPEEVKDAVFALQNKEVSKPVQSQLGWHIFVVNSIEAEKVRSLDDVKKDIEKELLEKKSSDEFAKFGEKIEDEFAAGKTMEDVAKGFDLVMHKVASVDAKGMGPSGSKVADVPDAATSLPLVFGMDAGTPSALTLLSDNNTYAIFRVDTVTPKRVKALDEVKGLAIKAWKDAQKVKLLKEKATDIASKLKSGEDYKAIISKMNLKLETAKTLIRQSAEQQESKVPSDEMKRDLFNLKKEGSFTSAYPVAGGNYAIARLVKVMAVQEGDDKNAYKNLQGELEDQMRDDIMASYTNFLRVKYPVEIKKGALGGEK